MSKFDGKVHDVSELVEEEELDVRGADGPKFAAVETKTGEEDFSVVWEQKATIKRFDEGENQWKERGSGDARILKHKTNEKQVLFLLRREAIGKLAANHNLTRGMRIIQVAKDKRCAIWIATKDYSDEDEGFPEKFLIKFTSEETCEDFIKQFKHFCN
eukprot:GDKJ01048498.1.p1 GENE.GDKJ01048498.1~~GDKJ01048498.1.p1  ORF type:complete len:158 (+),score=29.78 GDKJ01048498.1:51-524(+)